MRSETIRASVYQTLIKHQTKGLVSVQKNDGKIYFNEPFYLKRFSPRVTTEDALLTTDEKITVKASLKAAGGFKQLYFSQEH